MALLKAIFAQSKLRYRRRRRWWAGGYSKPRAPRSSLIHSPTTKVMDDTMSTVITWCAIPNRTNEGVTVWTELSQSNTLHLHNCIQGREMERGQYIVICTATHWMNGLASSSAVACDWDQRRQILRKLYDKHPFGRRIITIYYKKK